MSELKFDVDDVRNAGTKVREHGIHMSQYVVRQLRTRPIPELPLALSGRVPSEITQIADSAQATVVAIIDVGQTMRNDAYEIGGADQYEGLNWRQKAVLWAGNGGITRTMDDSADFYRNRQGGDFAAGLIDGAKNSLTGMGSVLLAMTPTKAGDPARQQLGAAGKLALTDPKKFVSEAIRWDLIKEGRRAEWLGNLTSILALGEVGGMADRALVPGARMRFNQATTARLTRVAERVPPLRTVTSVRPPRVPVSVARFNDAVSRLLAPVDSAFSRWLADTATGLASGSASAPVKAAVDYLRTAWREEMRHINDAAWLKKHIDAVPEGQDFVRRNQRIDMLEEAAAHIPLNYQRPGFQQFVIDVTLGSADFASNLSGFPAAAIGQQQSQSKER